jgi:hypothetical protein
MIFDIDIKYNTLSIISSRFERRRKKNGKYQPQQYWWVGFTLFTAHESP